MQFPKQLFITGTDTEVGKTFIAALLSLGLGRKYWKPLQSGPQTDRKLIQKITELPDHFFLPESYHFHAPLSIHAAAELESREVFLENIQMPDEPLIIEGAGGVLHPISYTLTIADLLSHFAIPSLIVSRNALGTLNHTLLTIEALNRRGISIFGVVLMGSRNSMHKNSIEKIGKVPVLAQVQWPSTFHRENLIQIFEENFHVEKLAPIHADETSTELSPHHSR